MRQSGGKLSPLEKPFTSSNPCWHVERNLLNYPPLCFWAPSARSLLIPPACGVLSGCWQWEVNNKEWGSGGDRCVELGVVVLGRVHSPNPLEAWWGSHLRPQSAFCSLGKTFAWEILTASMEWTTQWEATSKRWKVGSSFILPERARETSYLQLVYFEWHAIMTV